MSKTVELKRGLSYAEKLTKKKIYHSQTIRMKMLEEFDPETIQNVIKILEIKGKIDDDKFIELLINYYVKKGYGKAKLKHYVLQKNIPTNVCSLYTYDLEIKSILNAYSIYSNNFNKYVGEEKLHKIYGKMQYLGFSNDAISYIINRIKGNEL